jgi:predicted RNA methylase
LRRQTAVASEARKALGAYYTPAALVAAALCTLPAPRGVVADLACGDGAWLAAAARRWPGSRLFGADIDPVAVAAARARLGRAAALEVADGTTVRGPFEYVIGNPPWGAGRIGAVRRGEESLSRFVDCALDLLPVGGRLCLLVPAAWLEIAAHREARRRLLQAAALERVQHLGHVFAGVHAPAALIVARREPDESARVRQLIATPHGRVAQETFLRDDQLVINARLSAREHALARKLESAAERLRGRARFILGVVTGDNRRALGADGEPIVSGTDVAPMHIAAPRRRLSLPLASVQQAAPRAAYARDKVVYRFVHAHPLAAVDRQGRLTLNSANAFALDDEALELDFVAAWLNSSAMRWLHRARHAMPRVLRSHLEALPLPAMSAAARRAVAAAALAGNEAHRDALIMDAFALDDEARALVDACPRS